MSTAGHISWASFILFFQFQFHVLFLVFNSLYNTISVHAMIWKEMYIFQHKTKFLTGFFVMNTTKSQIAIWFSSLCVLNFIFVFCFSSWILCYGIGVCGF